VAGFAKLLISFTALVVFGAVALTMGGGIATIQAHLPACGGWHLIRNASLTGRRGKLQKA